MSRLLFTKRGNRIIAVMIWALLIILFLLYRLNLIGRILNLLPPCFFRSVTGLLCPGCGITRATISLLRFNLVDALRYNPPYTFFALTALVWLIWVTVNSFRENYKIPFKSKGYTVFAVALLIMVIVFGALRNFSWFPIWFYR